MKREGRGEFSSPPPEGEGLESREFRELSLGLVNNPPLKMDPTRPQVYTVRETGRGALAEK